jgi:hypothetical protein
MEKEAKKKKHENSKNSPRSENYSSVKPRLSETIES